MPNYLHRTTKEYLVSVGESDLPEAEANYIYQPDLSAVAGQPSKYWVITGDVVSLADQATRDAIDAANDQSVLDGIADELDETRTIMRAFAEVVVDEINLLRAGHGLAARTLAQLKSAVRQKLG